LEHGLQPPASEVATPTGAGQHLLDRDIEGVPGAHLTAPLGMDTVAAMATGREKV
jgi:hypothetical protein